MKSKNHSNFKYFIVSLFFYTILLSNVVTANPKESNDNIQVIKIYNEIVATLDHWRGSQELLEKTNKLFQDLMNLDNSYAPAYVQLARFYMSTGYIGGEKFDTNSINAAVKALNKAKQLDPNFSGTYVYQGFVYTKMGFLDDAEKSLLKAKALKTTDDWFNVNLADVYIKKKQYKKAEELYSKLLKKKSTNIKAVGVAYSGLIDIYSIRGELDKIDELYLKRIKLEPMSAWALGNYAHYLLYTRGNFDQSIYYSKEALKIMNYNNALQTLVVAYYAKWAELLNTGKSKEKSDNFFKLATQISQNYNNVYKQSKRYPVLTTLAQTLESQKLVQIQPTNDHAK